MPHAWNPLLESLVPQPNLLTWLGVVGEGGSLPPEPAPEDAPPADPAPTEPGPPPVPLPRLGAAGALPQGTKLSVALIMSAGGAPGPRASRSSGDQPCCRGVPHGCTHPSSKHVF